MKKHYFVILFVFLSQAKGGKAENYLPMLTEGRQWHYQVIGLPVNSWFWSQYEHYAVIGEDEQDGKTYHKIFYKYEVEFSRASLRNMPFEPYDTRYRLSLREENGHVYVRQDEYEMYVKNRFGLSARDGETEKDYFFPYIKTTDGEYILYDFTMQPGDCYNSVDGEEPVMVVSVDSVTTSDSVIRRRLMLSNGLVLIEGIGCINSPCQFLAYLNTYNVPQKYVGLFSVNDESEDGTRNYFYSGPLLTPEREEDMDLLVNLPRIEMRKSQTPSFYDLQGRRLTAPPTKGVYVSRGRKYVVK